MKLKSKYNCAFCLTPISKGHFENQNGKCQRCQYNFPASMPLQVICAEFGCTEYAQMGKELCTVHELKGDKRYNEPKRHHGVSIETIDSAIENNPIYREVRDIQRRQVGYGMVKYPETLNPMSWDMVETIDHILEESADKMHYFVMLKQQIIKFLDDNKIKKV